MNSMYISNRVFSFYSNKHDWHTSIYDMPYWESGSGWGHPPLYSEDSDTIIGYLINKRL